MRLTFERKLPIILFFVFLMLTTVGVVFYQTTSSLQAAIEQQRRSQEVVSSVDDTIAASFEIQMGLNSFMLIGNSTYLDPLEHARQRIRTNLEKLRSLTANKASQQSEVMAPAGAQDPVCRAARLVPVVERARPPVSLAAREISRAGAGSDRPGSENAAPSISSAAKARCT